MSKLKKKNFTYKKLIKKLKFFNDHIKYYKKKKTLNFIKTYF